VTLEEIESVVVDRLAAQAGQDPSELHDELEVAGEDMPCNSVLAAEVLVEVERRCGVRLPMDHDTAVAMRSVRAYARAVLRQLTAVGPAIVQESLS
jgi:acyl carrier protein